MNRFFIISFLLVGFTVILSLFLAGYEFWRKTTQPPINDTGEKQFVCPKNNTIDCMPIIEGEKKWFCSQEYLDWAKTNCPEIIIAY